MKCKLLSRVSFLVASLVILPTLSWGAEDGAALYKSKCARMVKKPVAARILLNKADSSF